MPQMVDGGAPIIRIVKKKKGHGGHHGGAWKVAYADFVTAMMAFFLVMWIVGLDKPIRESIASYFKNPSGFVKTSKGGDSPMSSEPHGQKDGRPSPLVPREGDTTLAQIATMQKQFEATQETILKDIKQIPELRDLQDSVQVHLTDEGLSIELIESKSSLFFDSGSASLKPYTQKLLRLIAKQLGKFQNPMVIEGHTDSHPLGRAGGYSNWELSADRANSARRAMETGGLMPGQVLAVRGYADRKPKHKDAFHYSNRRVSILLAYSKQNL
jgi:chemotaxis protein MotB